jgi:hypothetical protein
MECILVQGKQKGDSGMDAANEVNERMPRVGKYMLADHSTGEGQIMKDRGNLMGLRKC